MRPFTQHSFTLLLAVFFLVGTAARAQDARTAAAAKALHDLFE
jgi:hypothetical protein